jgi:hypothetical protein
MQAPQRRRQQERLAEIRRLLRARRVLRLNEAGARAGALHRGVA